MDYLAAIVIGAVAGAGAAWFLYSEKRPALMDKAINDARAKAGLGPIKVEWKDGKWVY